MANTKKEHYVPRCYLKNFASKGEEYINVFDKHKMEVRTNQRIFDVAMENHFYDLNLADIYRNVKPKEQKKIKKGIGFIGGTKGFEKYLEKLDQHKPIEKSLSQLEGIYSNLLLNIIKKSYNGNKWVIDNCYCLSKNDKELLSLFIAIQIIRSKSFRDTLGVTIEKLIQTLAYKSQMKDPDALPKDAFEVSADKDFVKLQHSSMILDPEMAFEYAKVVAKHIWVIYVNKTDNPFYTSDNPIINIPHKFDEYISYGGLQSEGVEIIFPLSSNLLLGMYDSKRYGSLLIDRTYLTVNSDDKINYFNRAQVIKSLRCVFCSKNNFDLAYKICTENPKIRISDPQIEAL